MTANRILAALLALAAWSTDAVAQSGRAQPASLAGDDAYVCPKCGKAIASPDGAGASPYGWMPQVVQKRCRMTCLLKR